MLTVFVLTLMSSFAMAADDADHTMIMPKDIKWSDIPSLPAGAKMSILYGDPSAAGPFGMRLKVPAKYSIGPHFHPADENVTVISGTFIMGVGDDAKGKTMALPAGAFARMKAGTHHFAKTDKEAIVQINGVGPWGITYVNPADDPRTKK
jgi:Cupin domain.